MGSIKLFDREEMSVRKPLQSLALVARDCLLFTYASAYEGRYIIQNWRQRLKHHKQKHTRSRLEECQYCNEQKREKDFIDSSAAIPFDCHMHLRGDQRVCKSCMDLALSTQLEFKPLIEVGCPECGVPWDPEEIRGLVSFKTQRKFLEMEKLARGQTLRPAELPDGATTETLLQVGTRFCPWCRWPFVKIGGCDAMVCSKCNKYFDIKYALVLEDGQGRRAAKVLEYDDSNDDYRE